MTESKIRRSDRPAVRYVGRQKRGAVRGIRTTDPLIRNVSARLSQDGKVYGDWMRVKSNVTSRVHIEASEPHEVEAAREEAKAYAALNDLVWFYIQDEGDVFLAAKLGVVPTAS
jgi:hypothetical protein